MQKKKKRKKKKTVVNSNQSNYTIANYLHIASIIMISNNGYLILKICHVFGHDVLDYVYLMYQIFCVESLRDMVQLLYN